jgi:uncharacterized repeat protein (TIGR04138 family)
VPEQRRRERGIEENLYAICRADSRYRVEAYRFIYEALDYTLKTVGEHRHVSGRELCEGIRRLALDRFGMMSPEVFREWGITRTDDFGEIVFRLVEHGLLRRTEQDTRDDFHAVYDFEKAFVEDFHVDGRLN